MPDIIFERFEARLKDLGLAIDNIDDEGLIYIQHGEAKLKISLDNVRKSYERDGDFDHLDNLIQSLHDYLIAMPIPGWDECKNKVYWSLFPGDFDFQDYIHDSVTDDFHKYYVYYDNNQYNWINHQQLNEWQIDEETFKLQVDRNMNDLLDKSSLEVLTTNSGAKLVYFETPIEELKAALAFSKNLKQKIAPVLELPVYCVLPVRDFCYMFGEQDRDELMNSLGEIVLKEYQNSGYEITTEILKISEDGIETIGKYQK